MVKVSLIDSQDSYQAAQASLKPFRPRLQKKISLLDKIVIKVNFVTANNELAATPVKAIQALVDFLQEFFSGRIVIAEESTVGQTEHGFVNYSYQETFGDYPQVELVDSGQAETDKVKISYPGGQVVLGLSRLYTQAPFIISAARAKTHDCVVVTLGAKNLLVGGIKEGLFHDRGKIHRGKKIHWILAGLSQYVWPDLTFVDGIVGMEGDGPTGGSAKKSGFFLASFDTLAADSLAAYLMGFDVKDIGYFNLLKEAGRGQLYPHEKIAIVGACPEELDSSYQPHSTFGQQRKWQID